MICGRCPAPYPGAEAYAAQRRFAEKEAASRAASLKERRLNPCKCDRPKGPCALCEEREGFFQRDGELLCPSCLVLMKQ